MRETSFYCFGNKTINPQTIKFPNLLFLSIAKSEVMQLNLMPLTKLEVLLADQSSLLYIAAKRQHALRKIEV